LSENEDEDRGGPVASLWFVFVDDSFECFVLSGIGESWAGAAAVRNDHETDWGGFGFAGPFKESLGNAPGCWPFGLPCVDCGIAAARAV
jgi:hypothetical protein